MNDTLGGGGCSVVKTFIEILLFKENRKYKHKWKELVL